MLEGVGRENGGRGFAQVQGGRQQKTCLQRQRSFLGMEACAKKQEVQNTKSGKKIDGQESSLCSENTTCSVCKACMKIRLKKKR